MLRRMDWEPRRDSETTLKTLERLFTTERCESGRVGGGGGGGGTESITLWNAVWGVEKEPIIKKIE